MLNFYTLEQKIRSWMKAASVPGAALAIVHHRQVIYAQGFGATSSETHQPVTPETLFRIGSLTKPMTATVIMRLIEAGQLDLDLPIQRYLPDLQWSNPVYGEKITLRHALSHTAGLQTHHVPHGSRNPDGLVNYIYDELPTHEFIAPPGLLYSYSNPGIRLAGYLMEKILEKNYPDLMHEWLFNPLEMTRSTFDIATAMTYPLAQSHDRHENGSLSVQRPYADNTGGYPSGSLISTVLDVAHFAMLHMNGGKFGQETILTKDSISQMQTLHGDGYTPTMKGYGLGWMLETINGRRWVGHDGSISTFGSKLVMLPDQQLAIVLFFNRAAAFWPHALNICHMIVDGLLGQAEAVSVPTIEAQPEYWADYCGTYLGYERGLVRIFVENNHLMLDYHGDIFPLQAYADRRYLYSDGAVGFVNQDYLMLDGAPCKRIDFQPISPDSELLKSYEGIYSGVEKVVVQVREGKLTVTHEEFEPNLVCIPLDERRFAAKLGLIEFLDDETLRLNFAYTLKKQKEVR